MLFRIRMEITELQWSRSDHNKDFKKLTILNIWKFSQEQLIWFIFSTCKANLENSKFQLMTLTSLIRENYIVIQDCRISGNKRFISQCWNSSQCCIQVSDEGIICIFLKEKPLAIHHFKESSQENWLKVNSKLRDRHQLHESGIHIQLFQVVSPEKDV